MRTEVAYRKNVLRLRNDLKARGYPMSLLPDAPYDEPARQKHIDKLFRRSREPKVKNGSMDTERLVFKVEYSQQLRVVNIRNEFKELSCEVSPHACGERSVAGDTAYYCTPSLDK